MLTQLNTLKARLNLTFTTPDPELDALLARAIQAMSDRFERHCAREFARLEGAIHEFPGDQLEIAPDRYPIESVARFESKVAESTGWQSCATEWLIRAGAIISLPVPLADPDNLARVIYTGGCVLPGNTPGPGQVTLPADLEHAALEQLAAWYYNREKTGLIRHWPDTGAYTVMAQDPLLPEVEAILARYKRWG